MSLPCPVVVFQFCNSELAKTHFAVFQLGTIATPKISAVFLLSILLSFNSAMVNLQKNTKSMIDKMAFSRILHLEEEHIFASPVVAEKRRRGPMDSWMPPSP